MLKDCLSRCHSCLKTVANPAVAEVLLSRARRGALFRRTLALVGLFLGLSSIGKAASITSTGTASTNSGWTTWSTTTVKSIDASYSETSVNATTYSTGTLSGFNFSGIPSSATIEGIQVNITAAETNTNCNGYLMISVSSNSGTNFSTPSQAPDSGELPIGTDTAYTEGGSTDTWGTSWTVAGATSTFQLRVMGYDAVTNNAGRYVRVDYVGVTMYYDYQAPSSVSDFSSLQSTTTSGQINLTWTAPGDDDASGNLTGNYRIQYATYTASWSTSSTPSDATTITIATSSVTPGNNQSKVITGLATQTTYYIVMWSQDNINLWSSISNTTSTFLDLTAPSPSSLTATAGAEQITLTWSSAGDDGASGNLNGNYRIQYATYSVTWSTSSTPTNATTVTLSTTNAVPGSAQTWTISGLTGGSTYYFGFWTQDDVGQWSTVSTTSAIASKWFDIDQIEVDGTGNGLSYGDVAWGDFDNDGDLDILASGGTYELRIYKNNGNGTIDATQIEVDGGGGGLYQSRVAWGDYDNDGDLDILASGTQTSGNTSEMRVYQNNGNGTINATQIEVDGGGGGLSGGGVVWGDYDNDGDLDVLASGLNNTRELRIYKNNGNGTLDATQIDVDGADGGLTSGGVAWGDFDNDGDLDILASGQQASGLTKELRVYKNNGNGTINATQIDVDGAGGGLISGSVAWGDFDNDGDLDILASGQQDSGLTKELRVYKNNGNGTINATQIEVDGAGGGLISGSVAWGDFDNDGDLDILTSGQGNSIELRVYKNNGNGTIDATQIDVDSAGGGLFNGRLAWGDFDDDGDLDILASGQDSMYGGQLRIYKNLNGTANTTPTAPTTLSANFSFSSSAVSIASMTWNAGTDSGSGATSENVLTYDIQISTTADFSTLMFPGQMGATPRMGSYLKPPKIFNSNTYYGTLLKSTDPWNAQATASYGLRTDTTYYYRVKTVDSALEESSWSSAGTLNSAVAPSTSTLAAATGSGQVTLTWTSAGDDAMKGTLTGNYRVQYATFTASWSTSTTPSNTTTVTIATTSITPGASQTKIVTGLFRNTTYYFALWSQDDVGTWSGVSNTTSAVPSGESVSPSTSTLSATTGQEQITLSWDSAGDDGAANNLTGIYRIQYATYTATWSTTTTPTNATTVSISTTNMVPGSAQSYTVTGLIAGTTRYFVLWSQDDVGNWSSISNTTSAMTSGYFDPTQIEVDGINGGLDYGGVAWGDFDNDGHLDILANGASGAGSQLRVYKNNGNGTFDSSQIEVDGAGGGLREGNVAWGDFDNDGDLDIAETGYDVSFNFPLLVYKNNGNGTFDPAQIEIGGANNGLYNNGDVDWGDYDNDGDLDLMICGTNDEGANSQLRIFKNNGNGTLNPTQIDIDGVNGGITSSVAWGDFDNDGDLDILGAGHSGSGHQLRVYMNNGNGTFDYNQIEVPGLNNGISGKAVWGDFDNDGDLDILAGGWDGNPQLRIYKNNGNGTFDSAQIEVDGLNGGLYSGYVAWGDFNNNGDLDILAVGRIGSAGELRVYKNNGNGTISPTQIEVDGLDNGLLNGAGAAWSDFDNDGDLDILASGFNAGYQLRVYKNSATTANTLPTAPATLSGGFTFNSSTVSIASFTWSAGSDSGTGATPENVLTYDLQISTTSDFSTLLFPGQLGASPRMGSYLKPPKIFNSNTYYGVVLKSTDPWNAQATASYGLRTDTTYYYRVKTVDSALAESAWSNTGSLLAGAAPSTSTLAATAGVGQVTLNWNSAGDDGMIGNLTGNYRIQYATYTASWSTSATPSNTTTVTVATTSITPGTSQSKTLTGLTGGVMNYFVLWTQDETNTWSNISNTASASPTADSTAPSTSTISSTSGDTQITLNWTSAGDDDTIGNLTGNYRIQYATFTASWSTSSTPTDATTVTISTANVVPGSAQTMPVTNLTNGTTYYFVLWSQDGANNWSTISNTASTWPADTTAPSTSTLSSTSGDTQITINWSSAGDDDTIGNLTGNYRIQYATYTATWNTSSTPTNATTVTIATTTAVPGSAISRTVSGLTNGTTYYFVLWSQDEANNWSTISNTASTWPADTTAPSTSTLSSTNGDTQITINWSSAGDDGSSNNLTGNYRIQYATYTATWNTSSTPTNATTVTIATTTAVPGSAISQTVSGLTNGTTYYFVLWSQDEANNWSTISNTASTWPADTIAPSTSTLSSTSGDAQITINWSSAGDDGNSNNLTGNYRIQYATFTASWSTDSTPVDATTVTISTANVVPGSAQTITVASLTIGTTYYFVLWSQDEANNWSTISNTTSTWPVADTTAPSTSTITLTKGDAQITLNWSSAGDDGSSNNLTGNYRIQYATYTATWNTSSTPTNATTVTIATTTAVPGSAISRTVSGLTNGTTYYFVLWSQDETNNWSTISNTASTWPADTTTPSTSTLTAVTGSSIGEMNLSWSSAGDDGATGNLTGNYRIQYATYTVTWSTSSTPTNATTVTIATTTQVPGSAQSRTITNLLSGEWYYFVLWSQDESGNWSAKSNNSSAVSGNWFDPNQIEVDGVGVGGGCSTAVWRGVTSTMTEI